jgi:hypothetical protein
VSFVVLLASWHQNFEIYFLLTVKASNFGLHVNFGFFSPRKACYH